MFIFDYFWVNSSGEVFNIALIRIESLRSALSIKFAAMKTLFWVVIIILLIKLCASTSITSEHKTCDVMENELIVELLRVRNL